MLCALITRADRVVDGCTLGIEGHALRLYRDLIEID
jgi:hypothetical protein